MDKAEFYGSDPVFRGSDPGLFLRGEDPEPRPGGGLILLPRGYSKQTSALSAPEYL